MTTPQVLVVGAGMTAAAAAVRLWCRHGIRPVVWEAASTIGGRMKTVDVPRNCDAGATRGRVARSDVAAQYLTPTPETSSGALLRWLCAEGVMVPFTDIGTLWTDHLLVDHFTAPKGMQHVVAKCLEGCTVETGRAVQSVERLDSGTVRVVLGDGETLDADAVIVTTPASHLGSIAGLLPSGFTYTAGTTSEAASADGTVSEVEGDLSDLLGSVTYSRRTALSLAYGPDELGAVEAAIPHAVTYTPDSERIRFVARDWAKMAGDAAPAPAGKRSAGATGDVAADGGDEAKRACGSVMVHTDIDYPADCDAAAMSTADVAEDIQRMLYKRFPDLPHASSWVLTNLDVSQVLSTPFGQLQGLTVRTADGDRTGEITNRCIHVPGTSDGAAPVMIAGDYLGAMDAWNINGAIASGEEAADVVARALGTAEAAVSKESET